MLTTAPENMKGISSVNCLGYNVFNGHLENIELGDNLMVNTINQYSYCIAEKDALFQESLKKSDVLLPDGIAIVHTSKFLYGNTIKKIAGADIHEFFLKKLNRDKGSCFYFGSSVSTLEKIENRLQKEYLNIRAKTYSPPFKNSFTSEENTEMISIINDFKPDVLFVGMTAPKQEKWVYANKNKLHTGVICSIGAVFDFYSGAVNRPSQIWINTGFEWLGRLVNEPKRIWKRYIYYGAIFVAKVIKRKLI